jgi:PAS domain S-box-containing protein
MSTFDGTIVRVNDAFAGMLGYSHDELVGAQIADITHPQDRERDAENHHALLSGAENRQRVTKRYLHADGHAVRATVWVTAMLDHAERPGVVLAHIMSHDGARAQA